MYNGKHRNAYVSVNLDVDTKGVILPRLIRWEGGRTFTIDQLTHRCLAESNKVGGGGMRYTVLIHREGDIPLS